jgi:dihydrofolate synthase/folylpolyglutamate synthase
VLDGAHTPAATSALASAFREEFGERRATVVLGQLNDKDPLAIAEPLLPIAERFIAFKPSSPRGLAAEELAESLATLGITVEIAPTVESAIASIDTGLALVTGSLTTVASAREALGLAVADPSFTA